RQRITAVAAVHRGPGGLRGAQGEVVVAVSADQRIDAPVAVDDVAVGIAGDVVVLRTAGNVLDVSDGRTESGANTGQQVDRDAGREERVVDGIDPAAAIDGSADSGAIAELEGVVGAAARQVLHP